jgi:hypothetical protein
MALLVLVPDRIAAERDAVASQHFAVADQFQPPFRLVDTHQIDPFRGKGRKCHDHECASRPENCQPHGLSIGDHCAEKKKAATSPRPPLPKSKS